MNSAGIVTARPDAAHVAARRHKGGLAGDRVKDLDPGPVESRVLRVVAGLVHAPFPDLLRVQSGRSIEDGDPVAHQLAVRDHGELTTLVGGHQVGDAEHGDVVDRFEAGKAGPIGRVSDVLVRSDARGHSRPATLKRNLARGGDLLQCSGGPDLLELD